MKTKLEFVLQVIPLTMSKDGSYHTSFVIYIRDAKHEGLYSMFFHNCYNYFHKYDSILIEKALFVHIVFINFPGQDHSVFQLNSTSTLKRKTVTATYLLGIMS